MMFYFICDRCTRTSISSVKRETILFQFWTSMFKPLDHPLYCYWNKCHQFVKLNKEPTKFVKLNEEPIKLIQKILKIFFSKTRSTVFMLDVCEYVCSLFSKKRFMNSLNYFRIKSSWFKMQRKVNWMIKFKFRSQEALTSYNYKLNKFLMCNYSILIICCLPT